MLAGVRGRERGNAAVTKASAPDEEEEGVAESDAASPPKRPRTNSKGKQKAAVAKEADTTEESEDEFLSATEEIEDEDEVPPSRSRKGGRTSKPPPSKSKATPRGSKGKKATKEDPVLESVDEESVDESALSPPKSSSKGKGRRAAAMMTPPSRASVATLASEHDEDEGTPAPSDIAEDQATPRAKRVSMLAVPSSATTKRTPVKSSPKKIVLQEEETEEFSLLDLPDAPSSFRPRVSALLPPPRNRRAQGTKVAARHPQDGSRRLQELRGTSNHRAVPQGE